MKKIKWVNFLHIYQPPWQRTEVMAKVHDESYRFLIDVLKRFPDFRVTINIAGTLLDQFEALGYTAIVRDLARLVARGQIELTGSSYSHAFLPPLPEKEIIHQIQSQEKVLKKNFPGAKPAGFFIPEMAYTHQLGGIIKKLGYRWLILDPRSSKLPPQPETKYLDRRTGLTIVFRNRKFSRSYPPEAIHTALKKNSCPDYIITATDGELYGHFHKDWQEHLIRVLRSKYVETEQISEYIRGLKEISPVYLQQASWETRRRQLKHNNAFSIWYNSSNPIHKKLWHLAHFAIAAVDEHAGDPNHSWARWHLDRGLASCSWWWASEIKTSAFASIGWSPDEIEHGATELIKSVRSIEKLGAREKIRGERMYSDLMQDVWEKHWKIYGHA